MITETQQVALNLAKLGSDNPNTKTAALLVRGSYLVAASTNSLPLGVKKTPERCTRPAYYKWICHAERDVLMKCAYTGVATHGLDMVMEWFPCVDCARAIIMAGIDKLHCGHPNMDDTRWGEDFKIAFQMLEESPVTIVWN